MATLQILFLTVQETVRTKMMIAYFVLSTVVVLGYAFTAQMSGADKVAILLRSEPIPLVDVFQGLTRHAGVLLVILGVITTSQIINKWLEKDAIDLLLCKPFPRAQLLMLRSAGAVLGIAVNVVYFITAMAIVLGVKLGVWNVGFILSSIAITIWFVCLTSLTTLFAVLTRSNTWTLFYTYATYFFSSVLLEIREFTLYQLWENPAFHSALNFIYYVLPQFKSMSNNILQLSVTFLNPVLHRFDPFPFVYSLLSAFIIYGFAIVYFSRRDF